MITIETMKFRTADMVGEEFPLVFWRGKGRIVGSSERELSLLVRGMRADFTWDRLTVTWKRFVADHTLTVDELGGGHDAVGIVSLFALMQADALDVLDAEPPPAGHPLLGRDDVLVTPHMAPHTAEATTAMGRTALEELLAVLSGGAPRYPV